jgi:hypothetical protein
MKEFKGERNGKSYTEKVSRHRPSGYGVYSKCAYGDVSNPLKIYRGKD